MWDRRNLKCVRQIYRPLDIYILVTSKNSISRYVLIIVNNLQIICEKVLMSDLIFSKLFPISGVLFNFCKISRAACRDLICDLIFVVYGIVFLPE